MNNSPYVVNVEHLYKSFAGKPAVSDVSLQIKSGEIFGFLGPNGSGKTTTIRMLCGLMTPDKGSGTCLGYNLGTHVEQIKRLVGYVPQNFALYTDLTVEENLLFIARVYTLSQIKQKVQAIMQELELTPYKKILAGSLSGGWKQRLSLAAALIHEPKLLLLDEPTAGVDPKARREFWEYIATLSAKGITSLVSTHYMDEAQRCNRLAYIVYGHLKAEGTVDEIIQKTGLIAYAALGQDLVQVATTLREQKGVNQAVVWGNEVRICGRERSLLEAALTKFPQLSWHAVPASLEEVFIYLVAGNEPV
jgi:ABC-2 type transport system ATP-binding protein